MAEVEEFCEPQIVNAQTYHGRYGSIKNAFKYSLNYILIPMNADWPHKFRLFSRNKSNLSYLNDKDYGAGGENAGAWAIKIAQEYGIDTRDCKLWLFTQPRILGYVFNPVSFWFFVQKNKEVNAVIAEVNNTFGDRHSYICYNDDYSPIKKSDHIKSRKIFHVSPFQETEGEYTFRFYFSERRVGVWIDYRRGEQDGLFASITGHNSTMTDWSVFRMLLKYPLGSMRVFTLIHWQALKLAIKGAKYKDRPEPPEHEVSR